MRQKLGPVEEDLTGRRLTRKKSKKRKEREIEVEEAGSGPSLTSKLLCFGMHL